MWCNTDLPWRNIWLADNPVEVLNEHQILSVLVGRYVPTKAIRERNKDKHCLMIISCMLLASSRRLIFGRWTRDRSRVNWEEFVRCQKRANENYSEDKRQFSDRN